MSIEFHPSAWVNDDIPPYLMFRNHERLLDILVRCDSGTALLGDVRHGERYQIYKHLITYYILENLC